MIAVLVTLYGRPDNVKKLIANWNETNYGYSEMYFALDSHDKEFDKIVKILEDNGYYKDFRYFVFNTVDVCPKFNAFYPIVKNDKYIGYLAGSDDIEWSKGFDKEFCEMIEFWAKKIGHRSMVLYGDDCVKGQIQATHWLATTEFLDSVGFFAPLGYMNHCFLDNWYMNLASSIGALFYCPHIKMKHNCPLDGKTIEDDNWKKVYNQAYFENDHKEFQRLMQEQFVNTVVRLMEGVNNAKGRNPKVS